MDYQIKQRIAKILRIIPDKVYLSVMFKVRMNQWIDWKNPRTFNEKIQWLKVYDRATRYTEMADKYEAKKYVGGIIGTDHIIPTLGVWKSFDDIDFTNLPNQFVLKCTHDSGGLVICKDKDCFDYDEARRKIEASLKNNYFYYGREWPYKNIEPRIIAEQFMDQHESTGLIDYKFYCFDGRPQFLYVSKDLYDHSKATVTFLDLNWSKMPFERIDYKPTTTIPDRPSKFDEMVEISRKLSTGHKFLRVDLYQINDIVYFSELTFHPASGYMKVVPNEYDEVLGKYLEL